MPARIRCLITLIVLFLFVASASYCAESNSEEKNPWVAAGFSTFVPGMGSIYTENYAKGASYLLIEAALIYYLSTNYEEDTVNKVKYDSIHESDLMIKSFKLAMDVSLAPMVLLGFHTSQIIEAFNDANKYNKDREDKLKMNVSLRNYSPVLSFSCVF